MVNHYLRGLGPTLTCPFSLYPWFSCWGMVCFCLVPYWPLCLKIKIEKNSWTTPTTPGIFHGQVRTGLFQPCTWMSLGHQPKDYALDFHSFPFCVSAGEWSISLILFLILEIEHQNSASRTEDVLPIPTGSNMIQSHSVPVCLGLQKPYTRKP